MRKRLIFLLQIIIAIVLVGTSVYATVNTTLELKVSPDTVNKGKEVAVTLSLKNVDSQKKIKSIKGYINYDENVLEKVTVDSIVKSEENTVKIGNETLKVEDLTNLKIEDMPDTSSCITFNSEPVSDNDVMIIIDFGSGISADTDLITVKFKVKSDANIGAVEKAIEYKAFVMTDSSNQNSEEITQNVKLTITDVATEDDTNKDDTNKDDTNKDDTNKDDTNKDDTNKNDTNKDDTNKDDTNKDDTNKDDTNKDDTNKNDTNKDNTNKNETNKNETNKNQTNTNKTNTNKNTVGNRVRNNTVDNTIAAVVLPATGARVVIIPAIIFILCAYIFYNRYMKYKDI